MEWYKLLQHIRLICRSCKFECENYIELSLERGAHINFTIGVEKEYSFKSSKYFSEKILEFLKHNPSSDNGVISISHDLFVDFTNNSLHYGIHDYDFSLMNCVGDFDEIKQCHQNFTNIIFNLAQDFGENFYSMQVEIAIQLLVIFANASGLDNRNLITFFNSLTKRECEKYENHILNNLLSDINENYNQNCTVITQFINESLIIKSKKLTTCWEIKWHNLIINLQKKHDNQHPNELYMSLIENLFEKINVAPRIGAYTIVSKGIATFG